uniref:Putative secreted protein n=1 Tax=Anopheles marajoara TaxID=58244 RepID=A0A2M4CDQ5_9DIPT
MKFHWPFFPQFVYFSWFFLSFCSPFKAFSLYKQLCKDPPVMNNVRFQTATAESMPNAQFTGNFLCVNESKPY